MTWAEKVTDLGRALGRRPSLDDLLAMARDHKMTLEEVQAQRESWVRGMTTPCEHGRLDYEQCPECRTAG